MSFEISKSAYGAYTVGGW